jgi:hypothetical protein
MREYNFAFLDESSKRTIRRALLKAVAIPGYQVPFGSRELPIGRGWGTGGIQITLSIIGEKDILKVIDQGSDDSVNAVSIRNFIAACTDGNRWVLIKAESVKAVAIGRNSTGRSGWPRITALPTMAASEMGLLNRREYGSTSISPRYTAKALPQSRTSSP